MMTATLLYMHTNSLIKCCDPKFLRINTPNAHVTGDGGGMSIGEDHIRINMWKKL